MALGYERGDTSVRCPYYVGKDEKSIVCMGGLDKDGKTKCCFKSKKKKQEYMEKYCRDCYGACVLCIINDKALDFKR